jgi:hypothetical protein
VAVEVPSIADRILTNAKQMLKLAVKRKCLAAKPLFEITAKQDLQIKKGTMRGLCLPPRIQRSIALRIRRMYPRTSR